MTDEVFNVYQIKVLKDCFKIAGEAVEANYRECVEKNTPGSPYEGGPAHWAMLADAVNNFNAVSKRILENDLKKTECRQWQEIMFLIEVIDYEACREIYEKSAALKKGLKLLVGMFRNQFPGETWNPEDVRWTTVGETHERGVSPMLMAISEL